MENGAQNQPDDISDNNIENLKVVEEEESNLIAISLQFYKDEIDNDAIKMNLAKAVLNKEGIFLTPQFGDSLFYSYREIQSISAQDYRIVLMLDSGETLVLTQLGFHYEDFRRILIKMRNETLLSDLLMNEPLCFTCPEAEFHYLNESGAVREGHCEARIYQTGIVVMPESGDLLRIPFAEFIQVTAEDYRIAIKTEYQEEVVIRQMGRIYDPFNKALAAAIEDLSDKVRLLLEGLFPQASPAAIRSLIPLMKDGKAVGQSRLNQVLPGGWLLLEDRLDAAGLKDNLQYLLSLTQGEPYAGVKRGLMGDLTGEYLWFLIPIYNDDPKLPGNAVAMESIGEGSGKATYFFRIKPRKVYAQGLNTEEALIQDVNNMVKQINRAMLAVNFRREPIYLPEERLNNANNLRYKTAFQRLASLQRLRELFIGRVIHSNPDQWRKDVLDLLKFNVSTVNDQEKWRKEK
jgi:hypothetical protein